MPGQSYWSTRAHGRRPLLRALGVGAAATGVTALIACGGTKKESSTEQAAQATSIVPTAPAGEPKNGGTVSVAFVGATSEQPNLDPHQTATLLLHNLGSGVAYSRLLKLKVGPDVPAGARVPIGDLAGSWETPDDTTYIFHMRPEAKWHNIAPVNARAVTADDVVYSFTRQRELKVNASTLGDIDQMQAVDPRTLKITIKAPNVDFLVTMGETYNKVVAREVVEQNGDLKTAPVIGSSAWIHQEWQQGSVVRFRKNPDYWEKDAKGRPLPYADALQILRIPDPQTGLAAFRTKQHHVLGYYFTVTKKEYDQLQRDNPELQPLLTSGVGVGTRLMARVDLPPTTDIRVRQALSKSLDRQGIIDGVFSGDGWYTSDIQPPAPDWILPQDELKKLLAQDIPGAKQLLQAAGFTEWQPQLKFLFLQAQQSAAELLPSMLQQIGVRPRLQTCDNICHNNAFSQSDFELLVTGGLRGTSTTADLLLFHKTGGSRNGAKVNDAQLDSLIEAQARERDEKKRRDLFTQIQRRVIDLAAYIPLGGGNSRQLVQPVLKNWWPQASGEYMQYDIVWLDR
jgi:peptide/nickel transport system substrate-binding protein